MMKVLYIAHYKENSGWGRAACEYIQSLYKVGIDVVCRPVLLNQTTEDIPAIVKECERKESCGATVCIQHVLPYYMHYNSSFKKNIALFVTETIGLEYSPWLNRLRYMDELWVPNSDMATAFSHELYPIFDWDKQDYKPIHVVPHASDITQYENVESTNLNIDLEGRFTFYFIGEMTKRKNIGGLIKAFFTHFDTNEPVNLLLKINKAGLSNAQLNQSMQHLIEDIAKGLKIYHDISQYPQIMLITDVLSNQEMIELHRKCNCFCTSSYGEAWGWPSFDAVCMGNTLVATNVGGFKEFGQGHYLVDGVYEPVFGAVDTIPDMFTGREMWMSPDLNTFGQFMRQAYESPVNTSQHVKTKFSHELVGNVMKGLLHESS